MRLQCIGALLIYTQRYEKGRVSQYTVYCNGCAYVSRIITRRRNNTGDSASCKYTKGERLNEYTEGPQMYFVPCKVQ